MKMTLVFSYLLLFSSGCTHYIVGINGYTNDGTTLEIKSDASFQVFFAEDRENIALHSEVKRKVENILVAQGYSIDNDNPDYTLGFGCGIDSGQTSNGVLPLYQPGGTATVNTFNSSGGNSYSTVNLPGTTNYIPYSRTNYGRYIYVMVFDAKNKPKSATDFLWQGDLTSSGSSSDLREVVNYMLVPLSKYLGQNTGKRKKMSIFKGDKRAKLIENQRG